MKKFPKAIAVTVALLLGGAATSAFATPTYGYAVRDIGTNSIATIGESLGANGAVYGSMQMANGYTDAFYTGANGIGITNLGSFGGGVAQNMGSNSSGEMAINVMNNGVDSGLLVDSAGNVLQTFAGASVVRGVSSSGQLLANDQNSGAAELLNPNGSINVLSSSDGSQVQAVGMGSNGAVVALVDSSDNFTPATVSSAGGITALMAGYGAAPTSVSSDGTFITGYSGTYSNFLAESSGSYTDEGYINNAGDPMFMNSEAVNDLGQVVGMAIDLNTGAYVPFLYSSGSYTNLSSAFDATIDAEMAQGDTTFDGINDAGQILLTAALSDGSNHTYLLTPETVPAVSGVPEPAAAGLFGLGLVGFMFMRRKKQDEGFMDLGAVAA